MNTRGLRILSIEMAGGILPNGAGSIVSALIAVNDGSKEYKIIADHAARCFSHGYGQEGDLTLNALNAAKEGWLSDFVERYYALRRFSFNYLTDPPLSGGE